MSTINFDLLSRSEQAAVLRQAVQSYADGKAVSVLNSLMRINIDYRKYPVLSLSVHYSNVYSPENGWLADYFSFDCAHNAAFYELEAFHLLFLAEAIEQGDL